jgi:hypothetical protein
MSSNYYFTDMSVPIIFMLNVNVNVNILVRKLR